MANGLFSDVGMADSFGIDAVNNFFLAGGGLKIDYFLVAKVNGVKKAVIPLPEQPESVEIIDEFHENPIYTFKTDYTYREIAPSRRRRIIFTGQVGTKRRINLKASGADKVSKPELVNVSGEENLKNFEDFLRGYHKLTAGAASPAVYSIAELQNDINYSAGKPYLEVKCFKEKISGRCVVSSFQYKRDIKSKRVGGYLWSLELLVYDDTVLEPPLGFTPFGELAEALDDMLANVQLMLDVLSTIGEGIIDETTGAVGTVVNSLKSVASAADRLSRVPARAINAVDEIVSDVLNTVITLYDAIAGVVGNIADLAGDSWNFADTFKAARGIASRDWFFNDPEAYLTKDVETAPSQDDAVDLATSGSALSANIVIVNALRSIENYLAMLGAYRRAANPVIRNASEYGFLESARGLEALSTLNGDSSVGSSAETEYRGSYYQYTMREGENLLIIATRLLGNPEMWAALAQVNRCLDAYTLRDGSPIVAGTVILVPTEQPLLMHHLGRGTTPAETTGFEDEYGIDLYINPISGDLVISDEVDATETQLSLGLDNLKQAIMIMIRTSIGDITADPRFGTVANAAIGSKFTEAGAALILSDIEELLLSDPRIAQVSNVVAIPHYGTGSLEISMDIVSYLGDAIGVRVPV